MKTLIAFPVLTLVMMFQMVVFSRLQLAGGTADLMLLVLAAWALQENVPDAWEWAVIGGLMVSFVSAMPIAVPLILYVMVTIIARLFQARIWQAPFMAMLFVTLLGTLVQHIFYILIFILVKNIPISFRDGLSLVTIPSLALNLVLAFPVYAIISYLAGRIYPADALP